MSRSSLIEALMDRVAETRPLPDHDEPLHNAIAEQWVIHVEDNHVVFC